MLYLLEKFRFNRVGLDEEKSGNMLEKLKWGAGGRSFKSSRPDQFLKFEDRYHARFLLCRTHLGPMETGVFSA